MLSNLDLFSLDPLTNMLSQRGYDRPKHVNNPSCQLYCHVDSQRF